MTAADRPRVLELYCGIGGCAAALAGRASIVGALDINTLAIGVYRQNFGHSAAASALESLSSRDPRLRTTDLWWLSPPCQPFTRRGRCRDLDDRRSASLLHVLALVERVRPPALALENVPEFQGSRAHARLRSTLDAGGYEFAERLLCPTGLGIPNRRRRFYLVASQCGLRGWAAAPAAGGAPSAPDTAPSRPDAAVIPEEEQSPPQPRPLAAYLDPEDAPAHPVAPDLLRRYAHAVDVVGADDPRAIAATFTAAYGRSPVRAGSYVRRNGVVRHFSPHEILRFLGFPSTYHLPPELPAGNAWRLLGNSLSVPAVREVLSALPPLAA